jgi:uncharacterized membrane protein
MRASRTTKTVWAGAIVLAALGAAAAIARGVDVVRWRGHDPAVLTNLDRMQVDQLARMEGKSPGSVGYRNAEAVGARMLAKFNAYPTATLLHVFPGALFMLLAPLQFVRRIRTRRPRLHRWSGRLLLTLAVLYGIAGLYFGVRMPFDGALEASAIVLFGCFFLYAAARGFVAIRRREIARHREWMIRMFSLALAISTVRVIGIGLAIVTHHGPEAWFGWSVWAGWTINAAVAELWIRHTRATPVTAGVPAPGYSPTVSVEKAVAVR